jgi:predicted nucleic acid-binding protein
LFDEVWRQRGRLVTSNWVLAELTALLTSPLRVPKAQQIQLLHDINADPGVMVVAVDSAIEAAAWQMWRTRTDKDWTVTDCTSFVIMQHKGIGEALTADHHFEQANFMRLLK